MAQPVLRVWLFGEVRAEFAGQPVRISARPMCPVLLAMLAVRPGTRLARETLAAELWPDESDVARVKGNLRRHLSTLQSELPDLPDGAAWIESDRTTLTWSPENPFWCDAAALDAALTDPDAGPEAFRCAGDFMRGYASDWVVAKRENYRALAIERLLSLCVERQEDDRLDQALDCASAILHIDPLCEEAVQLAIELHGERGDPIAAGQVYAAFAERLRRELDALPSATTLAAIERVRAAGASRVERLPRTLTTFVGRGAALESLTAALEGTRCVTIVGPGGMGKTRLSLETARGVAQRFADGSAFIDFSALAPESPIVDAVVRGLELPNELANAGADGVKRFLRNRRMLLIFDNCEHVREACAEFAGVLLAAAPRIAILATSRAPLGIGAERIFRLGPLSRAEAGALFKERSRRIEAAASWSGDDLERIDRICEALDRSPLAVELVAGLAQTLRLPDVEAGLADRFALLRSPDPLKPARHRALEATIAWSFELLGQAERQLFTRLAVFPSSFTFDAAIAICGATPQTLLALIEKSMVQRDDADANRYRLLLSLALFAQARFVDDEAAREIRDRHAEHYAALAVAAESDAVGEGRSRWTKDVEVELENVRAAMRHQLSAAAAGPAAGIRTVLGLTTFFAIRGYYDEGLAWLDMAQRRTEAGSPQFARIRFQSGHLLTKRGDFPRALAAVEEALAIFRAEPAGTALAQALAQLGAIHVWRNDFAAAERCLDEARYLAESDGLAATRALVHANLGVIAMAGRDEARARACFTDAARLFKSVGDRRQVALMLDNLAGFEFVAGRYGEAAGLLDEALLLARGAGDVELTATILCDIGDLLLADGRAAEARERFGEALVAARRRGLQFATGHALLGFAGVAAATEAPEVAARLIGASTGYLEYGLTTHINDQLHQRTRKAAIEQIGEAAFEAQRLLGELMDFEDAVRLAADSYGERAGAGAAQPDAYT